MVMLFGGCAMEEDSARDNYLLAVMENEQTRTSVEDDGYFSWSAGDMIWLQTTSGSAVGELSSGEGSSKASFNVESYIGELTGRAVYPYNSFHFISDNKLCFVLPASYDLGRFLENSNAAMYGVNVGGIIKFNHLSGVMRFVFMNVPTGVNKFTITLDKKINGTFEADLTDKYPIIETRETLVDSEKTITLNFDALSETTDIKLYVPLPVGIYSSIALALFNDDDVIWSHSNEVTNTINRKSLILMPVVALDDTIDGELEELVPSNPSFKEGDYVDEYGLNHGQGVKIGNTVWAPVNCGYHAKDYPYGKLYQWGRKYGQGYDENDATIPIIRTGGVSLAEGQSQENKNVFYKGVKADVGYDWLYPQTYNLWNSGTADLPKKNVDNDPCPTGWRVPTNNEFSMLSMNYSEWGTNEVGQKGMFFTGKSYYVEGSPSIFFPAAGLRYFDGSSIDDDLSIDWRGTAGYYWSSVSGTNLYFHKSDAWTDNSYRAFGYSIRCVQE